ncbi:MAG: nucleotidyl transferase AbiEii/AbiGii toxin family protein [Bacillota bacterium]|nr:nucleotidyl transferase AbiEii/AbiGii toxin family protein [Bacillota bacterium]
MTKEVKNVVASVRARLTNIARSEKRTLDSIMLLYMQERLLYRISISQYVDQFVLKGGLLMFILTDFKGRPTRDMDFLAQQVSNDMEHMKKVFTEICDIKCEDDGLVFMAKRVEVEEIKKDADYKGVRVKVVCLLGSARNTLQLDIGFGDTVTPKPQIIECPVLLDMNAPKIKIYSLESIISEKFQAMIVLSISNSRMKDFYDIYTLLIANEFDGRSLQEAVFRTLQRRHTAIEKHLIIFEDEFIRDESRNKMWAAFLKKINVAYIEFSEIMKNIIKFLKPVYDSLTEEDEFFMQWNYTERKWNKYTDDK